MSNYNFFRPAEEYRYASGKTDGADSEAIEAGAEQLMSSMASSDLNGVAMPRFADNETPPERDPIEGFAGRPFLTPDDILRPISKTAKTNKPARLVDHNWTEEISDPPFFGRDVALNNKPELARFRQFAENALEEDKLQDEVECSDYYEYAGVQVLNKITDILNESLDDKRKTDKISTLLNEYASRGFDFRDDKRVKFLQNQVGPAGELYVIAGQTEKDCREHSKQIRIRSVGGLRPKFVCARWDGNNPDVHSLERIYQLPVRASIKLSVRDFEDILITPLRKTADGSDLVDSILSESSGVADIYRRIKRATVTTGALNRLKAQSVADVVVQSIPKSSQPLPAPKIARSDKVDATLYNTIFACIASRDFRKLRSVSKPSHPVTAKAGGAVAYRRALFAVMQNTPGLKIYATDIGAKNPDRPSVDEVARFFGVPRHEHTRLASVLNNVKFERGGIALASGHHDGMGENVEKSDYKVADSLFGSLGRTASLGSAEFAQQDETRDVPFSFFHRQAALPKEVLEEEAASDFDESEEESDDTSIKSDHSVAGPTAKVDAKADIGQPSDQMPLSNFDFADPRGLFPG